MLRCFRIPDVRKTVTMPISAYYPGGDRIEVPPEAVKEWQSQVRRGLTGLGLASWYAPREENPPEQIRIRVTDEDFRDPEKPVAA